MYGILAVVLPRAGTRKLIQYKAGNILYGKYAYCKKYQLEYDMVSFDFRVKEVHQEIGRAIYKRHPHIALPFQLPAKAAALCHRKVVVEECGEYDFGKNACGSEQKVAEKPLWYVEIIQ